MSEFMHEEVSVNGLWENRKLFAMPWKKDQICDFYLVFLDFINRVHFRTMIPGSEYEKERMQNTAYWRYMARYYRSGKDWRNISRHRKALEKRCQSAINLYYDIKENGMLNPLEFIEEEKALYLHRGNRRLVILKILGVEKAKIRIEKRA